MKSSGRWPQSQVSKPRSSPFVSDHRVPMKVFVYRDFLPFVIKPRGKSLVVASWVADKRLLVEQRLPELDDYCYNTSCVNGCCYGQSNI